MSLLSSNERDKLKKFNMQGQEETQQLLLDSYGNGRSSSANDVLSQEKIHQHESLQENNLLSRSQQNHQQIELIQTEAKIAANAKPSEAIEVRDNKSSNFRSGFSEKLSEKNGTQDFISKIMMRTDSTLNNSGKVNG